MPNLFTDKTDTAILRKMLDGVPENIDKRAGSVVYDALAPVALELASVYADLERLFDRLFADTAELPYLSRIVKERGITPRPPSSAVYGGICNLTDLPDGTKFTLGTLTFTVITRVGDDGTNYAFSCDDAGADGNFAETGVPLLPVGYINGFTSAKLTALLIPGRDGETASELRARFFDSLKNMSYGGNIADYRGTALALDGVGAARIVPAWNGGGTVKVILLDSLYEPAAAALAENVQDIFDGIAPVGHVVTVVSAAVRVFDLDIAVQLENGVAWADVYNSAREAVRTYLFAERRRWEMSDIVVRVSRIEAALLDIAGVVDVTVNTLDGSTGNLILGEEIPALGELSAEIF